MKHFKLLIIKVNHIYINIEEKVYKFVLYIN